MVEYSLPFDQVSYKIVIRATGTKLEWKTYIRGKINIFSKSITF